MNIWVKTQNVVSIPGLQGVWLLLIHSDLINAMQSGIVNHLERPRVMDQELLVTTCPNQVQNEYMDENTECGVHPGLTRCMASSDSFRCHRYHLI